MLGWGLGLGRGLADGEAAVFVSRGPENSTGSARASMALTDSNRQEEKRRPSAPAAVWGRLGYALASPPEQTEACHEG